ncbi:MAG: oligoendopeptidase F [Acidaminococcaceae bacterium]
MTITHTVPEHGSAVLRHNIPQTSKWHIEDIFTTISEWEESCKTLKLRLKDLVTYQGRLHESEQLLNCLALRDTLSQSIEKIYAYTRLQRDTDNANQDFQELVGIAENITADYYNAISFIEPEILTQKNLSFDNLEKTNPKFRQYKHYLEDLLRKAPHVLPTREEEILSKSRLSTSAAENIFRILTGADISFSSVSDSKGDTHAVSEGSYLLNMTSRDRTLRENTFKSLMGTYRQYRNTLAASLAGNCRSANFYATIHNYQDTLSASLAEDNIPVSLYDNLINTIHTNLDPLHDYIALKKDILSLSEFHAFDLYVSLAKEDADTFSYTYPEACKIVQTALAPLGDSYCEKLSEGFSSGWIDVYENKGKRSGAYSWGIYGVHPFVLLNYQPRYNSVSTIAHEMGHAMHSYLSSQNQTYINSDYSIFCAEVASTTNEILLLEHMLGKADKNQKIYLLNQFLEAVRTTVYRQVQFAEFEKSIHEEISAGKTLVAKNLEELWLALNKKYYGESLTLDQELSAEWSRIPHFYTPFYVYKYATGYSAATTFADLILQNQPGAKEKYLQFLSSGGSDYSLALLQKAGVDLNTPMPIEYTLRKFKEKLAELKVLLR